MSWRRSADRPDRAFRLLRWSVAIYVVASLAPFQLDLPRRLDNGATLDGGVATFERAGIVTFPTWDATRLEGASRVVVDVTASPSVSQTGPARILSVSADVLRQDLVIGQSGRSLIVRVRRPGASDTGSPDITILDVFGPDKDDRQVQVVVDELAITVALEGQVAAVLAVAPPPLQAWDPSFPPVLGNEHDGTRPWLGTVRRAVITVDGTSFDLLREGVVPATFWELPTRWAQVHVRTQAREVSVSLVLHGLVMGAIGFLAARRRPTRPRMVAAAGLGLIAATYAAKWFIVARHPSPFDMEVEVLALGIGMWLAGRSRAGTPGLPVT